MFVPTSQLVVADRYELIDEIGRGSMGVIWRARQTNLGIECAIKFIHAGQAHDPELRRRFVREARAAASLKSPHSVHILDVDEWQGCLFIAMELLIGETLEARLERVGRLSPDDTLEIVDQVARGLNKAHAARLVHRDLKPDNIFLVDDEPLLVKILDFGIAKRLDNIAGLQTASGALLGTPGYMSPEQALASKTIDYRSDLWSLAVVVFRCLTGVEPFDGDGIGQILVEIVKGPLKKPSAINPHLPPSLDDWWLRATQREPEARHESATELVNDLKRALESQPLWPESAFEPTVAGNEPSLEAAPATLEPVLAAQRNSSPAAMRYSVAMVPALIASGWFIGRALWSPSPGEWRTDHTEPSAASVSFAVEPVTAAPLPPAAPTALPVEAVVPAAAKVPGAAEAAQAAEQALAGAAGQPGEAVGNTAGAGGAGGNAAAPASSAGSGAGSKPLPSKDVPSAPALPSAPPARVSEEPGASKRAEPRASASTPTDRRDEARRSGAGGAASRSTGRRSATREPGATPPEADAELDRAALDAAPPGDGLRPSREDDPDLRY